MLMIAFALMLATEPPAATVGQTTLFAGDARVTDLFRGVVETERVLLRRTVQSASITEIACVAHPGRPAITAPAYLTINGAALTVSDRSDGSIGAVTGTGRAVGDVGAWRELHLAMTYTSPRGSVAIRDENYLIGGRLIARKQISLVDGPAVQLWEAELEPAAAPAFEAQWAAQGCGSAATS